MDKPIFIVLLLTILSFGYNSRGQITTNGDKTEDAHVHCMGTSMELSHNQLSTEKRYENYRNRYKDCTYVEGNLEIVFLNDNDYDLSFLESIQEVDGYVLIYRVYSKVVPLRNLRIIRGSTRMHDDGVNTDYPNLSLYVGANSAPNLEIGLEELQLTSLQEISQGSVLLANNHNLCFENTILWEDIFSADGSKLYRVENRPQNSRACNKTCHSDCPLHSDNLRHCWGPGREDCQKMTKLICSLQCDNRCWGTLPRDCCHSECAGGCSGPTKKDCWACRNFLNGDECIGYCPKPLIYDNKLYTYKRNPAAKFAYGRVCIKECPQHMVVWQAACTKHCPPGSEPNSQNFCEECQGPCSKTCVIEPEAIIDSLLIRNLTNCTVLNGNVKILLSTFQGDEFTGAHPMDPSALDVFKTVREITGFLMIQGEHANFSSLDFFSNLTVIHGRDRDEYSLALHISRTSLQTLDLRAFQSVANGKIAIVQNRYLCLSDSINWTTVQRELDRSRSVWPIVHSNRDVEECRNENIVCDEECKNGCWGLGPNNCVQCRNFKLKDECLESCDFGQGLFAATDQECDFCDPECELTCRGPGPANCTKCKHFKDGPYCVGQCPESKYPDENGICRPCHENCKLTCTGPLNTVGPGGCEKCEILDVAQDFTLLGCLPEEMVDDCGHNKYKYYDNLRETLACVHCHPLCDGCYNEGPSKCYKCKYYREGQSCVTNCSSGYYDNGPECSPCHRSCRECFGPGHYNCTLCRNFQVYLNLDRKEDGRYYCTDECPEDLPLKVTERNPVTGFTDTICVPQDYYGKTRMKIIAGTAVAVVAFILLAILIIVCYCFRRTKTLARMKKDEIAAKMTGLQEELEPLTVESNVRPDMSLLITIVESELRRGSMVGSGAFGTVYKGFWVPRDQNNVKIPVAIKVLQEGTASDQNNELLAEARVMASVKNRFCVPIVGVCMAAQMMLVTPYMPLGCLLDYVRKNKDNISSKVMLSWCAQIAQGMKYLEDKGIVHRDLAARNVLVQSPKHVRVTDFGLAKMLDITEEQFQATGGKMPIKWLALECIQHRIFTHKSDVWSYGVTLWELFTYGNRPYETIRAKDIPELLEKGERLCQPPICTIDIYMILIKCWMLDASSRPLFRELADEFGKMSRDPNRYLVIADEKLMRLPSHSPHHRADMFRNMSVAVDGPEEIVEAEDYLQPKYDPSDGFQSPAILEQVTEEDVFPAASGMTTDNSLDNSGSASRGSSRYSGLERAMHNKRNNAFPRTPSNASRYSKDPCLVNPRTEDQYPTIPAPPTPLQRSPPGAAGYGKVPTGKEPGIAVDENDYLQPQSTQNKYVDVIEEPEDYLIPSSARLQDIQENPEYFEDSPAVQLSPGQAAVQFKNTPSPQSNKPPTPPPPYEGWTDMDKHPLVPNSPITPGVQNTGGPNLTTDPPGVKIPPPDYYNDSPTRSTDDIVRTNNDRLRLVSTESTV